MKIKLTIPEPCHEGWEKMKPNEKGRFCDSCCKTVIDFTKKSNDEIKEYFLANAGTKTCGRMKRSQLDSIVIQIPQETFQYNLSFQKLFLLALLLTMGSMLFSCKTDSGKIQKIDKIEVIDTITKTVVDTLKIIEKDSVINNKVEYLTLAIEEDPEEPKPFELIEPGIEGGIGVSIIEEEVIEEEEEEEIESDAHFKGIKRKLKPITEEIIFGGLTASKHPKFPNSSSKNFEKDIREFIIKGIEDENLIKELDNKISFQLRFKVDEKGDIKGVDFVGLDNDIVKKTFIKRLGKVPKLVSDKSNYISKNYTIPFTLKVD